MRIRLFFASATFASATFFSSAALAADTQLLNLVMPDAQIMAGMNVTTAKISPFGQYVLSQFRSDEKGFQEFVSQTGFDPRHDVTEIMAASSGDLKSKAGLVLARGSFDATKMAAAVNSGKSKATITQYAGATLISLSEQAEHSVAFIGNSIVVVGDTASVKAALDRADKVNSISPALTARVQTLSTTLDAWTVSLASLGSLLPSELGGAKGPAAQPLALVKNIESSSGGVKFGANVEISGQAVANNEQNAKALADIVRMVAGLFTLSSAQDPKLAGLVQVVQSLKVENVGTAVNISASVPEAQLEALMKPAAAK